MIEPRASGAGASGLGREERSLLLRLARAALEREILGAGPLDAVTAAARGLPLLQEPRGVFVTLRGGPGGRAGAPGALRGCMGHLEGRGPLYRGVADNAVNAGRNDPRFAPVTGNELEGLVIEISVLTPLLPVDRLEEVRLGRDGLELRREGRRAVFLPQVAPEQGWDMQTTLEHLCLKAGLDKDAWRRPGTLLSSFRAEVFAEGDEGLPPPPLSPS